MRLRYIVCLLCFISFGVVQASPQSRNFDKSAFYAAMASSSMEEIDAQLAIIRASTIAEKDAYEGALLMKKSGMVNKAKDKLNLFKAGRTKLESSLAKETGNTEFHFLRLIIQEHAPKIVNYRNELEKDSQAIRSNFKTLPPVVQQAIIDYSKKSTILKPAYF
jgi:hypothetical protein